ncbi:MAG: hypothetical protein PHR35_00640 [Kiritimatiellae bacterium]|nr:hypothetical protein [Kiritimatiellia bacterium]
MKRTRWTATLACAHVISVMAGAHAGQVFFGVPSGNWNVPGNWTGSELPDASDQAVVGAVLPGQTAILTDTQSVGIASISYLSKATLDIQATGDLEVSGRCEVGGSVTGTVLVAGKLAAASIYLGYGLGRLVQSGGTITSPVEFSMGFNPNDRAIYEQYGGTNAFGLMQIARHNNAYGVCTITNGALATSTLTVGSAVGGVGGTGVLTIAGSASVAVGTLHVGSAPGGNSGFMSMDGGMLTASAIFVSYQGFGCWTQSAGTVTCPTINISWSAGVTGRCVMTSGVLNGDFMRLSYVHGTGTIASMDLYGGMLSLTNLTMGTGTGSVCTVRQYGGTNRIANTLRICDNIQETSAYIINGGLLEVGNLNIGGQAGTVGTLTYGGGDIRAGSLAMSSAGDASLELVLTPTNLSPIQVSGTVTLNDALTIRRAGNFYFAPGAVVTAMTYSARNGTFARNNILGGMECRVNYDVDVGGGLKAITLDRLRPVPPGTVIAIR